MQLILGRTERAPNNAPPSRQLGQPQIAGWWPLSVGPASTGSHSDVHATKYQPGHYQPTRPSASSRQEIGMTVVARILLDHVDVDPAQGTWLTAPYAGVIELVPRGCVAAVLALGLPRTKVSLPAGIVEWDQLAVVDCRVIPDGRRGVTKQNAAEPVSFDLGHVANEAVQRQLRGGNRPRLTTCVIEALTLQEQGGAVELQPRSSISRSGSTNGGSSRRGSLMSSTTLPSSRPVDHSLILGRPRSPAK